MSRAKKSNEKIRATLTKSFIDCVDCPACGSENYRRIFGDVISSNGWSKAVEEDSTNNAYIYIIHKECRSCGERHVYRGKLELSMSDYVSQDEYNEEVK